MARRLALAVALCVAGAMTAVMAARQPAVPFTAEREYLVQFRGPIQESWKTAVTTAGATLLDYQPPFAFRARLRPSDISALNALEFVSAVSPYRTDAKFRRARG